MSRSLKKKMLKNINLKPCPFCGAAAAMVFMEYVFRKPAYMVQCQHCGAMSAPLDFKEIAKESWNIRVKGCRT